MQLNGHYATTPAGICDLFADYFKSVYNPIRDNGNSTTTESCPPQVTLNSIAISYDEVLTELKNLDTSKGAGPELIPPIFLKSVADQICFPLYLIMNKSIEESVYPSQWKISRVCPIFKSGDSTDIINYRPISILNCCNKIFERLLNRKLLDHVAPLISVHQHGFVKGKSTLTNLLTFTEYIYSSLSSGVGVDVVYTDFSKAFDKVSHSILISKMRTFGLTSSIIELIKSYLTERQQYVQINHISSSTFTPTSGIPQGSILGPLLFILFINDIVDAIQSKTLLFADDLKIFSSIKTTEDIANLQEDLQHLHDWCVLNDLFLNIDKCSVLQIKPRAFHSGHPYHIGNSVLDIKDYVKDLGILIDCKLNFNIHIQSIVNKALKMLGFLMRIGRNFRQSKSFISIYNGIVRSNLEYLSTIWNPLYKQNIICLEKVQKKFTRFLNFKTGVPYEPYEGRLERYNLMSLQTRRIITDEVVLFKLMNYQIQSDLTELLHSSISTASYYNLRNTYLFDIDTYSTNYRVHSPFIRLKSNHNQYFNSLGINGFSLSLEQFRKAVSAYIAP